ncbi:hypothetical protein KRP22_015157 [Phytophthora ramorum]|nr:hypothetical protein KRP22_15090 [Phytophthora ramorum]
MTVREFLEQVVRDNDNMYECSNDGISLSLAKKNGDWLQEIDPDFLELRRGGVPNGVYEIMTDANNGQSNASVPDAIKQMHRDEITERESNICWSSRRGTPTLFADCSEDEFSRWKQQMI